MDKCQRAIMKIKGHWDTRRIAGKSIAVKNHSPDGFAWGYGGSGPAQLALAICLDQLPTDKALACYQAFKWKYIAMLPPSDFETEIEDPKHFFIQNEIENQNHVYVGTPPF